MTADSPQHVVFIDSRVPDIQDLLDGVQPGDPVFVLDPSTDGVQQIADILAANNFTDLASVSVVSHGETGTLDLGSSVITDTNLAAHSKALAEIGSSLAPSGSIQLYGCDVAQGAAGQQFINDFSTFAGGIQVDASTQPVGSAAFGGSWILDAASAGGAPLLGGAPAVNAPFTPTALANFQGALGPAPASDPELWIAVGGNGGGALLRVDDVGGTATNATTFYSGTAAIHNAQDVVLDPTSQAYFVLHQNPDGSYQIVKGSLVQALNTPTATPTFTTVYTDTNFGTASGNQAAHTDVITQIALDTVNHQIYFTDNFFATTGTNETDKFERINYDGSGLTTLATITHGQNAGAVGFALDLNLHEAVFGVNVGGLISFTQTLAPQTFLYEATGVSAAATSVSITQLPLGHAGTFTLNPAMGFFTNDGGLAIDPTTHKLYFTLENGPTGGGLFEYDLTSNTNGTINTVWHQSAAGPTGAPVELSIDPTTGEYFIGFDGGTNSTHDQFNGLWRGLLASTAAPTSFLAFPVNGDNVPEEFSLDQQPTLSITPANTTFTESTSNPASTNNTPVGVISADTATDPDNSAVVSATVSVGSFFVGDVLSDTTVGAVTSSYNSTTGVLTLTGVDSFANYQSVLNSVKFTSTSENPTDFGSDNSRVLSFSINDGLITSAPQTAVVTVVGVNDPPTLTAAATASFTEKGGAKTLSSGAAVSDSDSLTLANATVKIVAGAFAGDGDVLTASTLGTIITASYNSATETLTLSGSDSLAHYQSVLDSVTFNEDPNLNPTNYGSNTTRTVTWQINDGSGSFNLSTVVTSTINVTAVNDPPTLTATAGTVAFTEGQAKTLSPSVTVTDPDNLTLAGATVKVAGGTFAGDGDVLTASTVGTAITASYNSTTETLTLSGSDTLANYQTVLDRITFASSSNPDDYGSQKTRTVTWVLNDGVGSNNLSTAQTTTVSITAINDPPALTSVAPSATYLENAAAVTLASTATVSDVDSLTLSNATVKIVGGTFAGDGDVLAADTTGTSITASYNAATETLTLSGSDTLAHYQQVLDHVTFVTPSDNPTSFGADPTRTVTWLLNDGAGSNNLSSVTTTTISVTAVNDAPTLTVATSASFTENGASFALSPTVTVSDPDNTTWVGATVKIAGGSFTGDGDVLAADTTGTAITASYDATTETLTLSGTDTLADYRQVLQSVSFVTASDNPTNFGAAPTRTITWVVNDGSGSNNLSTAQTETLSITAVNDPPTLSAVASSASYTEQAAATVLSSTLSVSDPDNLKLTNATVKITGGTFAGDGDVLSFSTAGTTISASYNAGTETLTLSGSDTLADYQLVLDTVAFSSTSDNPTLFGADTTRTITWLVNDGSGSSSLSAPATTTVTLTAVNDAPTLAGTTNASFTENSPTPTTLSPSVTVSDPDNQTLVGATVAITGGTFVGDGDVLATSTAGTGITASYDAGTETLILSGTDTLANYRTVLDKVTFTTPSDNPTLFGSDPTRTVTWVLNDGSGSNNLNTTQTTIGITAVNDPPTLSAVPSSVTFAAGTTVTLASLAAVADPDSQNLVGATVSITAGAFAGDVLAADAGVLAGTSITASYNVATETLTLSGTDTLAHYQSVLDTVSFSSTAPDPSNANADPTRTISWVLNDGSGANNLSAAQTETLSIQNGPAVNPPAQAAFTENQASPVTLAPSLVVTDSNAGASITSATVALTGGTFAGDGDVLTATASGSVTVSYDAATESLILSGTDTLASYQSVLDSVTFTTPSDNPTDFGADPTRTVTWTITDSNLTNNSGSATSTISITAVNDPPTVAADATHAFTEGQTLAVSPNLAVTDPDSQDLVAATVQIASGTFAGDGDVLAVDTTGTNITASYDAATETLLLTGSDTLGHYQSVLDAVTFASGDNPTDFGGDTLRFVTWVVNDGSSSFNLSTTQFTGISIAAVDDPPTLSVASSVNVVPTVVTTLSPTAAASDPDSLEFVGATVSIVAGTFAGDGDLLAATTAGTAITASYNAGTETLTLSGTDTLAHYQQVLDSVTFDTTASDPLNGGSDPTRTVSWVLDDGSGSNNTSTPQTTTVSLQQGAAVVPAVTTASYTEGGAATTLSSTVTVVDTNLKAGWTTEAPLTASEQQGAADVVGSTLYVLDGNFNPQILDYDIATNTWQPDARSDLVARDNVGSAVVGGKIYIIDGNLVNTATTNEVTVFDPVADTVTQVASTQDAVGNPAVAAVNGKIYVFGGGGGVSGADNDAEVYDPGTNSWTEIAAMPQGRNAASAVAVGSLIYVIAGLQPGSNAPEKTVLVYDTTNDTWSTAASMPQTAVFATAGLVDGKIVVAGGRDAANNVTTTTQIYDPVSNSWTIGPPLPTAEFFAGQGQISDGSQLFVAGGTQNQTALQRFAFPELTSATVAITGGTFAGDGDVLSFSTTGAAVITGSYDSATETLVLTGSDSLAHYQAVLESVAFSSTSLNPTDFGADPTRTVTWTVNDGTASNNVSTATSTISVTAVNDPPTFSAAPGAQFTEGPTPVVLSSLATVTDPDSLDLVGATVSITTGTFAGDGDVLGFSTAGTSITASYDSTNEVLILSGSDTLGHYQQVLDSVTFNSTSDNPTDFGSVTSHQVTWVLDDGSGSFNTSTPQTTTVTLTAVNDAPTVTSQSAHVAFTLSSTVTLSPTLAVADPDNQSFTGATVSVTDGTFAGDGDVLNATTLGNITASYNSSTETLRLSGSDTLADYQQVLDSVIFASGANPNNFGSNSTRTISWVLNDGSGSFNLSAPVTTTVDIEHIPPTLTNVAPSVGFTQASTVVLSPAITVSDIDSAKLASATMKITGGAFAGDGDVLSATGNGTIVVSYNAATETLTLTGTDTLAHYQTVLDSVKFASGSDPTNHGSDPTRTVTWAVNDGNGSSGLSAPATSTITITPLDAAPTLSLVAPAASFTEGGSSITLSSALSISDPDSTTLTSATVLIAGGAFAGDGDVLSFSTTGTAITASYDSSTETLTLTGSDTLAHYKQVLDQVTFGSTSHNPTDFGSDPTRTVTWTVADDFNVHSAPATTTVSITGINDAPTLTAVAPSVTFTAGTTLQLSPTLTVSDVDSLNLASATVKITGGTFAGDGDVLSANIAGTHITSSYDSATETLTLTGPDPLATFQSVLDSVSFASGDNPSDFGSNLTRTVTWVVNDGGASNSLSTTATTTIDISTINTPPALSNVPATITFTEGQSLTLAGSALVTDPDSVNMAGATVRITGGAFGGDFDVLAVSTIGTSITANYNAGSQTLALTGSDTKAHYQQVLDSLTFAASDNPDNFGSNPIRTVTWLLDDGSASNNLSTIQTTTISITAVNDPPTLFNATPAAFTENGAAVPLSPGLIAFDPDNLGLVGGSVQITGGTFAGDGDVLGFSTAGTAITASYDSATETLTLTGSDTIEHYQQVLDTVTFVTPSHNPTDFGAAPTRTITWTLNDGSASSPTGSVTTTVGITAINDAPTLSSIAATATFTEKGAAVTLAGAASVADVDNLNLAGATVKITGGTFAGDGDVLGFSTAGTSITASYNAATETLTLTGSDTLADYQQVLDSLTFSSTSLNPTNFGSNTTRTVTWLVNDGSGSFALSATQTETVSLTAVNDAPTVASVTGVTTFVENGAAVTASPTLSVSDPDSLTLVNATVSVGNGFAGDGDVLAFSTAGTSITGSYNAATETLVFSGIDTVAHYQSVLDSVTFVTPSDNPTNYGSNLSRVLTWVVNDGSASSNLSTAQFTTVVVTAVNDAPTLTGVPAVEVFHLGQTLTLAASASLSDPDNLTLANATVRVTAGTFAGDGDALAATTTGTSILASYNAATETLTLTGSDTLAHYSQVLDSVTFSSGPDPSNSSLNPTRTLSWTVNDGAGSNNITTATTTLSISTLVKNDFNGNHVSDIIFQDTGAAPVISGRNHIGGDANSGVPLIDFMSNGTVASSATLPSPTIAWHIVGSGDFNSDSKSDILFQSTDGTPMIWTMNGPAITSQTTLTDPGASWRAVGTGDFNGDNKSDILFQNSDGTPLIWTMNGTSVSGTATLSDPGASWRAVGTGDFNNDGKSDLVFQNSDGTPMIWLMNGTSVTASATLSDPGAAWRLIGTGDFNNDGVSDLLFQNNDGTPMIWTMNGTSVAAATTLPNPGAAFRAVGTGDYTGDGKSDILFQSAVDGTPLVWTMNGTTVTAQTALAAPPNPGANWHANSG